MIRVFPSTSDSAVSVIAMLIASIRSADSITWHRLPSMFLHDYQMKLIFHSYIKKCQAAAAAISQFKTQAATAANKSLNMSNWQC